MIESRQEYGEKDNDEEPVASRRNEDKRYFSSELFGSR